MKDEAKTPEKRETSDNLNSLARSMFETDVTKRWASEDHWTMTREYGRTPNGNPISGRWVLRDHRGWWVDFDKYSNDLAERNNLKLDRSNKRLSNLRKKTGRRNHVPR